MQPLKVRAGVIDQIKKDRNFTSDVQLAAALGITPGELEAMRHGATISPAMALQIATIQGSGFDLSPWVERQNTHTPAA